jgi:hypothetical protein
MKLEMLSVAQDNGHSDRITAQQRNYVRGMTNLFQISVTNNGKLTITHDYPSARGTAVVEYPEIDLDGLIQFLQDAKTFVSEEEMYQKLKGK